MNQSSEMQVKNLLDNISQVQMIMDAKDADTAKKFNAFQILDIAYDEVRLCRVLFALIDPKGTHSQRDIFLRLFLEQVLGVKGMEEEELRSAKVFREYIIPGNRRIDLVIQTKYRFIPIEVKIYALDQIDQCADYIKYAKTKGLNDNDNWHLYYLTRFGEPPNEYSHKGEEARIQNISWNANILPWLKGCIDLAAQRGLLNISEVLRQFIDAINLFTETVEDEKMQRINEIVNKDATTYKAALLLEATMTQIKTDWLILFFEMLTQAMKIKGYERTKKTAVYDFDGSKGKSFYFNKNTTYPGICFEYHHRDHIDSSYEIYARVEIWQNSVGVGYLVLKNGAGAAFDIAGQLPHPFNVEKNITAWWSSWKYVTMKGESSPNFKNPVDNEPYMKWVSNEDYRKDFVAQCATELENLLNAQYEICRSV